MTLHTHTVTAPRVQTNFYFSASRGCDNAVTVVRVFIISIIIQSWNVRTTCEIRLPRTLDETSTDYGGILSSSHRVSVGRDRRDNKNVINARLPESCVCRGEGDQKSYAPLNARGRNTIFGKRWTRAHGFLSVIDRMNTERKTRWPFALVKTEDLFKGVFTLRPSSAILILIFPSATTVITNSHCLSTARVQLVLLTRSSMIFSRWPPRPTPLHSSHVLVQLVVPRIVFVHISNRLQCFSYRPRFNAYRILRTM